MRSSEALMDEVLAIKNIFKSYGGKTVLNDISLTVGRGEVVSVIGSSGSGKSTLLRCATHLTDIDSGSVAYNGEYMVRTVDSKAVYAPSRELKRICSGFGLVFQNHNLFPHMTVMKNITAAPISVMKTNKEYAYEKARALLKRLDLSDKADAYPFQLSGGQQQRVSIARALICDPEILFFDEPTSALDPELTAGILRYIKDLAAEKMTMVIVTHEMSFARKISSRVVFMNGGTVAAEGAPDELFNNCDNERLRRFLGQFSE
ncbi:MAG: amino acid ABC transporter ATP-binding protein [Clostridia bacterium]|nr:amino acid ABC transporter ATP-binding protein [Clostridia bacterium]